jgi:hypothetical protein
MISITNLKKGIKGKDYCIKHFSGGSLVDDRDEWLEENPEIIIFNTHIFVNNGVLNHVIEYIKNVK